MNFKFFWKINEFNLGKSMKALSKVLVILVIRKELLQK